MPATGSGGFSGSFSGRVGVSREQSFYLVVFGSQAYRRDGYRVHRRIGTRTCQIRRAVQCERRVSIAGVSARSLVGSWFVAPQL